MTTQSPRPEVMKSNIENYFEQLKLFLAKEVAAHSNTIDHDEQLLKQCYLQIEKLGALKLLIPKELSGLGGERREWIEYNILMAQYSGALLFLQAQHQFAVTKLKQLLPNKNVSHLLHSISETNLGLGIALAATRQLLQVKRIEHGFSLTGKLLWVTGYRFYSAILCSFDYEGIIYYTLLPFKPTSQNNTLIISSRIETTVFNATNTVGIALNQYFISDDDIITSERMKQS